MRWELICICTASMPTQNDLAFAILIPKAVLGTTFFTKSPKVGAKIAKHWSCFSNFLGVTRADILLAVFLFSGSHQEGIDRHNFPAISTTFRNFFCNFFPQFSLFLHFYKLWRNLANFWGFFAQFLLGNNFVFRKILHPDQKLPGIKLFVNFFLPFSLPRNSIFPESAMFPNFKKHVFGHFCRCEYRLKIYIYVARNDQVYPSTLQQQCMNSRNCNFPSISAQFPYFSCILPQFFCVFFCNFPEGLQYQPPLPRPHGPASL